MDVKTQLGPWQSNTCSLDNLCVLHEKSMVKPVPKIEVGRKLTAIGTNVQLSIKQAISKSHTQ